MTGHPDPLRLLWLGHSHLRCVRAAADEAAAELAQAGIALEVLILNPPCWEPHFTPAEGGRPARLNPELQQRLLALAARADVVALSVGGNAHNALGLVEQDPPFDFRLEDAPDEPLLPGRVPLPGLTVREVMLTHPLYAHQSALRAHLAALLQRPLLHLESPPPIADERFIRTHPGYYAALLAETGPAPLALRRKLWRLHSRLVAEDCAAAGIEFVPAPPAGTAPDGSLRREAWFDDPTHANAWYGRRAIEHVVGRHRPGFAFAA